MLIQLQLLSSIRCSFIVSPTLPLRFFGGMTYKKASLSEREVLEHQVSHGLEDQIENRKCFSADDGQPLQPIEGVAYYALVQSPIISSGDVRQRDVPAKQGKRPSRGRRAEAHSGSGELLGKTDGAVMDIGAPSVKDSLFFAVFSWMVHIPLWQLFDSCSS